MASEFIARPTQLLCRLLRIHPNDRVFMAGRMSVALEIVTVMRTLDEIPSVMLPNETAVVQSVLQTLLVDQDLIHASVVYDELSATRRPVFVPVPSHEGSVASGGPPSSSSVDEEPASSQLPIPLIRALVEARQSPDVSPTSASVELRDVEDETTPSE
jgi:hypothetical protein